VAQSVLDQHQEGENADQKERDRAEEKKDIPPTGRTQGRDYVAGDIRMGPGRVTFRDHGRRLSDNSHD
jgi:hypothetical protein